MAVRSGSFQSCFQKRGLEERLRFNSEDAKRSAVGGGNA